jgi:hypothetical protein
MPICCQKRGSLNQKRKGVLFWHAYDSYCQWEECLDDYACFHITRGTTMVVEAQTSCCLDA